VSTITNSNNYHTIHRTIHLANIELGAVLQSYAQQIATISDP